MVVAFGKKRAARLIVVWEQMKVNMTQGGSMRRSPARLGSPARAASTCLMLVFLLPLVLRAEAQKIKIQYEKTTDFSKFKTYAWVPGTPVFDPHLDTYIQDRFAAAV